MKVSKIAEWVDQAVSTKGAVSVQVRRAAKFGKPAEVMASWPLSTLDLADLVGRCEDDVERRRLGVATFFVEALDQAGAVVVSESVRITAGDDEIAESIGDGGKDAFLRYAVQHAADMKSFALDCAKLAVNTLADGNKELVLRVVSQDSQLGTLVANTLELAEMKGERQAAQLESEEKRAFRAVIVEKAVPVVGAVVAEMAKAGVGTKVAALLETLTEEQATAVAAALTPEQRIAFERIMRGETEDKAGAS